MPSLAHYEDHVGAYGTVLDLANLTMLNTNYVAATSQLNTAKARLAASHPAFERAQSLYERNIDSLAQKKTTEATVRTDRRRLLPRYRRCARWRRRRYRNGVPSSGTVVAGAGLVNRLIERDEFLMQITLPPGVSLDPPPTLSVEIGGRRVDLRYISPATRTDTKI